LRRLDHPGEIPLTNEPNISETWTSRHLARTREGRH